MTEETILRRDEGAIAVLTLNKPHMHNAMDTGMIRRLGEMVAAIASEPAIRVIVIAGAGDRAFSAGGDLDEMLTYDALRGDIVMESWQWSLERIERSPKPVIAAIQGYAYGGGTELAMACHLRVARADAKLGQTEIALDHLPGGGGTQRLPRLVPIGLAMEYLLTGDAIPAEEAWRLGLVNHVWSMESFWQETMALAGRIAERSPTAVRYTLECVREGLRGPPENGQRLERALACLVMESEEARAGIAAFKERRRRPNRT